MNTIKQIDVYTEQNVRHYDIHIQGIKWRSSMVGGTLTTPQEMLDASPGFYYILDLIDTHPDFNAKQGVLIVYQNPTGKTYQAIVGDKIWLYKSSDGHYYPIEGGGGSAYGGLLTSEQDMDAALPGKYYAFTLHEAHSEIAASNGSLFVMNSDEADGVIQVATVVISGAVKQYARSGEVNAYSPFAEISGVSVYGGDTPPTNPKLYDLWTSSITLNQYQWLGSWVAFVPTTEISGIIDASVDDGIVIDCRINDGIIIDCRT